MLSARRQWLQNEHVTDEAENMLTLEVDPQCPGMQARIETA